MQDVCCYSSARVTAISKGSSIGTDAFRQCINIGNGRRFEFGGSFKRGPRSTQSGGGRLRLTWYEKENCAGRYRAGASVDPNESIEWKHLIGKTESPPNGATSVSMEAIQGIAGPVKFIAYWDDIYLRAKEISEGGQERDAIIQQKQGTDIHTDAEKGNLAECINNSARYGSSLADCFK